MKQENSKRVVQNYEFSLQAAAENIFPLLCPTREYEWIDGWRCDLVYSDSGVAENNCIFRTAFEGENELLWTVSRYEPDKAIEFVIVGDGLTLKLDLSLTENGDSITLVQVTHTITALNGEANELVKFLPADFTENRWRGLENALDHYLRTGRMLMTGN